VLDRAARDIELRLASEPMVQARLMRAMADVDLRLGLSGQALPFDARRSPDERAPRKK
jgi:hypothetical protein